MTANVGRIALRVQARASRRERTEAVTREIRAALPDALQYALRRWIGSGVAIVPRMRVTLRAPLAHVRGRDLARAIADACVDAAAAGCTIVADDGTREPVAERTVDALRHADGVRVSRPEHEAAAWLIALARDDPARIWRASPYDDLRHLTLAQAFASLAEHSASAGVLVDALGRWARAFAERCAESDARRIVTRLAADVDIPTDVWRVVAHRFANLGTLDAKTPWRVALLLAVGEADAGRRGAFAAAARTFAAGLRGPTATAAPRALIAATESADRETAARTGTAGEIRRATESDGDAIATPAQNVASGSAAERIASDSAPDCVTSRSTAGIADVGGAPAIGVSAGGRAADAAVRGAQTETPAQTRFASELTGLWCLLPHLARLTRALAPDTRRAAALKVAEHLAGAAASDDPAIAAWCGGIRPSELLAGLPPDVRVPRLAVGAIRGFARTLRGFERARCTYVLRAILSGTGVVTACEGGWTATLPRAPLRVVLDYAALLGEVHAPWDGERYAFAPDESAG